VRHGEQHRELSPQDFCDLWAPRAKIDPEEAHRIYKIIGTAMADSLVGGCGVRIPYVGVIDLLAARGYHKTFKAQILDPTVADYPFQNALPRWKIYLMATRELVDRVRMMLGIPTEIDFQKYKKRKGRMLYGKKKGKRNKGNID